MPVAQQVTECRLHSLLYTLLRHAVDFEVYRTVEPVTDSKTLPLILPSIIHLVSAWLSASRDRYIWKTCFKFSLAIAIVNLFDIARGMNRIPKYVSVSNQFRLYEHCSEVLHEVIRQWTDRYVLGISELGIIMLEHIWTVIQKRNWNGFVASE